MRGYGWALVAVGLAALVVGGMMRRTPWLNRVWVVLGIAIVVTFGGSRASLHDGSGNRLIDPQSWNAVPTRDRMAFGKTTLDLTHLGSTTGPARTVHMRPGRRRGGGPHPPRDLAVAVDANASTWAPSWSTAQSRCPTGAAST